MLVETDMFEENYVTYVIATNVSPDYMQKRIFTHIFFLNQILYLISYKLQTISKWVNYPIKTAHKIKNNVLSPHPPPPRFRIKNK